VSEYVEEFWKEVKPEDFLKNRDMIVRVRNGHIGWSAPTKLDGYTLTSDSACEMINLHVNNKAWGMPEFPPVPVTYKVTWYANGSLYDECQMYDPPEYWLNKPTPNPGYRLLNKYPHENVFIGDECWNAKSKCWVYVGSPSSNKQPDEVWFSRRIEDQPAVSKTIFDNVLKQGYRLDAKFIHHPKVGDSVVFPSGLRVVVNEKGFTVS